MAPVNPNLYEVLPTTEERDSVIPQSQLSEIPASPTTPTHLSPQNGEYSAVPTTHGEEDDIEVHPASVATHQTPTPADITAPETSSRASPPTVTGYDGVFATMAAKPELPGEKKANSQMNDSEGVEFPPEYNEVVHDSAPPYFDTTIITTMDGECEEVLVEGLPVGSPVTFFTTMLVSMTFQFVGFLLTYLLSTTWAGRRGSLAGFGITLLHYGLYLRARISHLVTPSPGFPGQDDDLPFPPGSSPEERTAILARQEWLSYLIMLIGWFMVIRSCTDFIRIRRMRDLIMSGPEGMGV